MKTDVVAAGLALFAALASPARANMFLNGTLDIPNNPALFTKYKTYEIVQITPKTHANVIAGWTIGGDSIDVVTRTIWRDNPIQDCVDLVGTSGPGSVSRTVAGLTPGDSYQLSFDFAVNPSNGLHGGESAIAKWLDISLTNSDTPDFFFKGVVGAQTVRTMRWTHYAVNFTATSSTSNITFAAIFPQNLPKTFPDGTPMDIHKLYAGPVVANVDLEDTSSAGIPAPPPTSPEPTTLALILAPAVWSSALSKAASNADAERGVRTPLKTRPPIPPNPTHSYTPLANPFTHRASSQQDHPMPLKRRYPLIGTLLLLCAAIFLGAVLVCSGLGFPFLFPNRTSQMPPERADHYVSLLWFGPPEALPKYHVEHAIFQGSKEPDKYLDLTMSPDDMDKFKSNLAAAGPKIEYQNRLVPPGPNSSCWPAWWNPTSLPDADYVSIKPNIYHPTCIVFSKSTRHVLIWMCSNAAGLSQIKTFPQSTFCR